MSRFFCRDLAFRSGLDPNGVIRGDLDLVWLPDLGPLRFWRLLSGPSPGLAWSPYLRWRKLLFVKGLIFQCKWVGTKIKITYCSDTEGWYESWTSRSQPNRSEANCIFFSSQFSHFFGGFPLGKLGFGRNWQYFGVIFKDFAIAFALGGHLNYRTGFLMNCWPLAKAWDRPPLPIFLRSQIRTWPWRLCGSDWMTYSRLYWQIVGYPKRSE